MWRRALEGGKKRKQAKNGLDGRRFLVVRDGDQRRGTSNITVRQTRADQLPLMQTRSPPPSLPPSPLMWLIWRT